MTDRRRMPRQKNDIHEFLAGALLGLAEVRTKRMFGAKAFFTGTRMFAFLMEDVLVLKLPEQERQHVLGTKIARPFLVGENATFGRWVEVPLAGPDGTARAFRLARIAHDAAQQPDREGPRRRRPSAKRRVARGRKQEV